MASRRPSPSPSKRTTALKRVDGEPLTRFDIQYDVLHNIFHDTHAVFTDPYSTGSSASKVTFHDLYIKTILRSPKATKALKDKMTDSEMFSEDFAMLALLVNVGRVNTTMSFFPEMKTAIRTYHPIPALQRTTGNLQDAPRIKHILKSSTLENDQSPTPSTPADILSRVPIGHTHFADELDFLDLFTRESVSSLSRARAFLWLCYHYLEAAKNGDDNYDDDGPANPFTDSRRGNIPTFIFLSDTEISQENNDPEEEKTLAEKLIAQRLQILKTQGEKESARQNKNLNAGNGSVVLDGDADTVSNREDTQSKPKRVGKASGTKDKKGTSRSKPKEKTGKEDVISSPMREDFDLVVSTHVKNQYPQPKSRLQSQLLSELHNQPRRSVSPDSKNSIQHRHRRRYSPYPQSPNALSVAASSRHRHARYSQRPATPSPSRTMLEQAWHIVTTTDPLLDSDEEGADEHLRQVITKARVTAPDSDDEDEPEAVQVAKKSRKRRRNATPSLRWWGGYSSDHNTWEPEENVAGCQRLLASFWEHVGTDDNDYYAGYEVAADETWIKKEKRHFALEYAAETKRNHERHEERHCKKTVSVTGSSRRFSQHAHKKKRKKSAESSVRSTSTKNKAGDDEMDVEPLTSKQEESGKEMETSSDDDIPLSKLPPRKKRKMDSSVVGKPEPNDYTTPANEEWVKSLFSSPEPEPPRRSPVEPAPLPPAPSRLPATVKPSLATPSQKGPYDGHISDLVKVPSGSGISTKQRLALGALAPVNPKAKALPLPKPKTQQPPPRTPSTNLMPTGFKKKTAATPVLPMGGTSSTDDIRSSSLPHSPVNATLDQTPVPFSPIESSTRVYQAVLPEPTVPLIDPRMAAAEAFLSDIMPPDLAAPLKPATETPFEPRPPRALTQRQPELPIAPHQLWTWSGPVFTEDELAKPAFEAKFCDATASINGGLNLRVALAPMDRLRFPTFHDAVDLKAFLPACQVVHQFARFVPKEDKDAEPLGLFSKYMAKMQKVTFRLKPPPGIQAADGLIVALVPWILTTHQLSKHHRNPPSHYLPAEVEKETTVKDENQWMRLMKYKPYYQHALRLLKFPQHLLQYLSDGEYRRTFHVWYEGGDGTKKKIGLETVALYKVLEKCNTKPSPVRDARIIFIHVGVIRSLRVDMFDVYLGGIVTFTPQAIADDPVGVLHRIRQIHCHPMWDCYLLPWVLGMVTSLYQQKSGSDPIADLDRGIFPFKSILDSIENAEISLISSPSDSTQGANTRQEWLKSYWTQRPHGQRATLKACIEAFSTISQHGPREALSSRVLHEISEDLRRMRTQPAIMAEHRRFVVIDSPNTPRVTRHDELEWTTTTRFDFKDDFFPSQ
ncbi:hypothetical protein H0H92_011776 [Tricholoma furcatifolium]|nr:hypothetical protein H0H92_011776 [Tricholoma furcatifolium]